MVQGEKIVAVIDKNKEEVKDESIRTEKSPVQFPRDGPELHPDVPHRDQLPRARHDRERRGHDAGGHLLQDDVRPRDLPGLGPRVDAGLFIRTLASPPSKLRHLLWGKWPQSQVRE